MGGRGYAAITFMTEIYINERSLLFNTYNIFKTKSYFHHSQLEKKSVIE